MDTAQVKLIVEKHADGYVAYPLGLKGVVVGQGDTYEDAVADVKSTIWFHIETFGSEVLRTTDLLWKSSFPKQELLSDEPISDRFTPSVGHQDAPASGRPAGPGTQPHRCDTGERDGFRTTFRVCSVFEIGIRPN